MSASETHVNFLGGSPLNRLSWLRTSTPFLSAIVNSPNTRWIVFNNGQPLIRYNAADSAANSSEANGGSKWAPTKGTAQDTASSLAALPTSSVLSLLGPAPFFGQGRETGEKLADDAHTTHTEAVRIHGPPVVFLGLHETKGPNQALPSSDFNGKAEPEAIVNHIDGIPYFALDVAGLEESVVKKVLDEGESGGKLEFAEPRSASTSFSMFDAAVFAEARSMLDWNTRNMFCPGCGSPTYTLWAGWKRACSSLLPWADNSGKKPCPSGKGLNNFSHPRTDSVVIMAVINETNDKVLLGRNRKFPLTFYSTLAGFIEPGESFEDAVKREIWEEAGVRVWGVRYHSGQPWPYPANLMVGFYAVADESQPIRVDLDNELADARWFTREEIKAVLAHPSGTTITRKDYRRIDDQIDGKKTEGAPDEKDEEAELAPPPFRVPPTTAIAGVLIRDWVEGKIGGPVGAGLGGEKKGHL